MRRPFSLVLFSFLFLMAVMACSKNAAPQSNPSQLPQDTSVTGNDYSPSPADPVFNNQLNTVLSRAALPGPMAKRILDAAREDPAFIMDLLTVLQEDPYMYLLVDKTHPLPSTYAPQDLVKLADLKNMSYLQNRNDLSLRKTAADALEVMAAAARADGVTLVASSTYRSYDYQVQLYARNVKQMGEAEANRVSAKPGESQHQLGLIVDFGSITPEFAETKAGKWLAVNAGTYGWSLSFPKGYEDVTGYSWECWHFRYVGKDLAYFIDAYFDGIQQYTLQFIHEWVNQ